MKRSVILLLTNGVLAGCCILHLITSLYLHSSPLPTPAVVAANNTHPFSTSSSSLGGSVSSSSTTYESNRERGIQQLQQQPEQVAIQSSRIAHNDDHTESDSQHATDQGHRQPHQQRGNQKVWRYDRVGPKIAQANTHYLSSIPSKYRLVDVYSSKGAAAEVNSEEEEDETIDGGEDAARFDRYASNPEHVWLKKLHLIETNPCIARLPDHYRTDEAWRRLLGEGNLPYYVASYRVTHKTNCYDGPTTLKLFGGSWSNTNSNQTDYLGISLMDAHLKILLDTTVNLQSIQVVDRKRKPSFLGYDDFRLVNLDEQLYLSSQIFISPIHLSLSMRTATSSTTRSLNEYNAKIPKKFVEISPAFDTNDISFGDSNKDPSLRIWIRRYSSCPVGSSDSQNNPTKRGSHKNLLYFGGNTTSNTAKVLFYPRFNPNDVRDVDLQAPCNRTIRYREERGDFSTPEVTQPAAAFDTIEAIKYPNRTLDTLFMADRGSACCTHVNTKAIYRTRTIHTDEVLVAIVHPKTIYPGKNLPEGVTPNTYLSRFIAFLPREPYTIVARSGMFCLGYPSRGMDDHTTANPLEFVKMNTLKFANETYECPRIHFPMGMVDTPPEFNTRRGEEEDNDGTVIVSYGVSDCLARFVEIPKAEIIRMLSDAPE